MITAGYRKRCHWALFTLLLFCLLPHGICDRLRIVITGVEKDVQENIEKRLEISKKSLSSPYDSTQIQRFNHTAIQEIKKAMKPYGYFNPKISSNMEQQGKNWKLSYRIFPGKHIRLRHVNIRVDGPGHTLKRFREYIKDYPLKTGDRLITPIYDEAKKELLTIAEDTGYLKSRLTEHNIRLSIKQQIADINLRLLTGNRYKISSITFEEVPFKKWFLERFLEFHEGEYYSASSLSKTQENFVNSQYFSSVSVKPDYDFITDNTIPVNINLTPRKKHSFSIGGGYSTDNGFQGILGWKVNRVNANGHKFNMTLQGSLRESGLISEYIIPGRKPLVDQYRFSLSGLHYKTRAGTSYLIRGSIGHIKAVTSRWSRTITLNLQHENQKKSSGERRRSYLAMPNMTWTYRSADDLVYAKWGTRLNLISRLAVKRLISETSFFQQIVSFKKINSFHRQRVVFKTEGGASLVEDLEKVPLSIQFFIGGPQSIRGFGTRSIGTGRYYFFSSLDYQFMIGESWGLSTFVDVGEVFSSCPDDRNNTRIACPNRLRGSVGVAFIKKTPVGLIQIGIARPFSGHDEDEIKFYFNLGPDL